MVKKSSAVFVSDSLTLATAITMAPASVSVESVSASRPRRRKVLRSDSSIGREGKGSVQAKRAAARSIALVP